MNPLLCTILPYRAETWDSLLSRSYLVQFCRLTDRLEYSSLRYDDNAPRDIKVRWGHHWDCVVWNGRAGKGSFICNRCEKRS